MAATWLGKRRRGGDATFFFLSYFFLFSTPLLIETPTPNWVAGCFVSMGHSNTPNCVAGCFVSMSHSKRLRFYPTAFQSMLTCAISYDVCAPFSWEIGNESNLKNKVGAL